MQLKITVRSAQVFKSRPFFTKMHLYAVVHGPSSSPPRTTTVDTHGGAAPFWWSPMEFEVDGGGDETLVAWIKCRRSVMLGSDKSVGFVELPVKALLEYYYRLNPPGNMPADIALTVSSKSGKPRGVLYMSYMFAAAVPSAPPLEDYARQYCAAAPVAAVVPSAPYLLDDIMVGGGSKAGHALATA